VLPTITEGQLGPVAGWISTSGWAAAAERELGAAWVVTRGGVLPIDEVRRRAASSDRPMTGDGRRARRAIPPVLKTLVKDARELLRARRFQVDPVGPWSTSGRDLAFVWQRHELFHEAGLDLADVLRVPSVLFVPASIVWQSEQWGVRRPGWGRLLERHGERPALLRATLVACGTDLIAEQVARLGVVKDRILVTPTGVDLAAFAAPRDRAVARMAVGVGDQFVIGWAGSFRAFHALDQLVTAAAEVEGATLLLVGDGPERPRVEQLVAQLGVSATFTGMVPHADLPGFLAAMDVGVVLARPGAPFHYSPLKLAEYLAAGLPIVAPSIPELVGRLRAGVDAELFDAGDVAGLASSLRSLSTDETKRRRLADRARAASASWGWEGQVQRVLAALADRAT